MEGSLGVCTKPRIKKILANWEELKEVCSEDTLVCGLPLPDYVKEKCCTESCHGAADFQDIFLEAADVVRGCLEVAFSGAIIFMPLTVFSGNYDTDLAELVSSGGLSVWTNGDLVHLTPTAYGDLAENMLKLVASTPTESCQIQPRRKIESIVTRATEPVATAPTLSWIIGNNMSVRGLGDPLWRRSPWPQWTGWEWYTDGVERNQRKPLVSILGLLGVAT